MFRTPVAEPDAPAPVQAVDTIPLSHLELDLPAPITGWLIELDRRGIQVVSDDIGRPSVSRDNARVLIAEHHQNEARKARMREEAEQAAIEADQQWRAQLAYAGSARIEVGFEPATVATTGLARYLIDLEGNRIVFDAGVFKGDFSSDPPTFFEHGLKRYEEVVCGALG